MGESPKPFHQQALPLAGAFVDSARLTRPLAKANAVAMRPRLTLVPKVTRDEFAIRIDRTAARSHAENAVNMARPEGAACIRH